MKGNFKKRSYTKYQESDGRLFQGQQRKLEENAESFLKF